MTLHYLSSNHSNQALKDRGCEHYWDMAMRYGDDDDDDDDDDVSEEGEGDDDDGGESEPEGEADEGEGEQMDVGA